MSEVTPKTIAALQAAANDAEAACFRFAEACDWFRDPEVFVDQDERERLANISFDADVARNLAHGALVTLFGLVRCHILTDGSQWFVVRTGEL